MKVKKSHLSASVLALIAAGAGTLIFDQFISEKEGSRLHAYKDSGGLYTICRGLTRIDNQPVTKDMSLTREQCDHYNAIERDQALDWLKKTVKVPLSDEQAAGIASFCAYNIGIPRCQKSTFWKKLNAGDRRGACQEIKRWIYDGGRDCRTTKGQKDGCYGQVIRRDQEAELACWGIDTDKE